MTINHVRNLLMNVSSSSRQAELPGEEFVPEDFRPRLLTPVMTAVRRILFGANPDRLFLNYRVRECMTLLHTTELAEFVTDLDPRITYWPPQNDSIFYDNLQSQVTQIAGDAGPTLFLQGVDVPNHSLGQLQQEFRVEVVDANQLRITRQTAPATMTTPEVVTVNGLTDLIALPDSAVKFRIQTGDNASDLSTILNTIWTVATRARPTQGLDSVLSRLTTGLGAVALIELFGITQEEPYRTWRNLWQESPYLPYKLGALLLAYAYRADQLPAEPPPPPPPPPRIVHVELFNEGNISEFVWEWTAPNNIVGHIVFECWGAGSVGSYNADANFGAAAGGGGAYAKKTIFSDPGAVYAGVLGDPTTNSQDVAGSTDTAVGHSPVTNNICLAKGGFVYFGGNESQCIGDVVHRGGFGSSVGQFAFPAPGLGGGGGSSAGPDSDGTDAELGGTAGAIAPTDGGNGGAGGTSISRPPPGQTPGGGGGGGAGGGNSGVPNDYAPGYGGGGQIQITYFTQGDA